MSGFAGFGVRPSNKLTVTTSKVIDANHDDYKFLAPAMLMILAASLHWKLPIGLNRLLYMCTFKVNLACQNFVKLHLHHPPRRPQHCCSTVPSTLRRITFNMKRAQYSTSIHHESTGRSRFSPCLAGAGQ
jgi:hypothetical protein